MLDSQKPKQKLAIAATVLLLVGGLGFFLWKSRGPDSLHRDTASVGSDVGITGGGAPHGVGGSAPSESSETTPLGHPPNNAGNPGDTAGSGIASAPVGAGAGASLSSSANGGGTAALTAPVVVGVTNPALLGGAQIAMIDKTANGSVPGTNLSTQLGGDGKAADPKLALAPPKPVEPEPACYTVTYTHKALAGHKNMDECSQHRNLIKLGDSKVSQKSVCVRVDGTPVKFDWVKSAILLGPVAGPNTKITVRYCQPKAKDSCADDCKLPKDDFMAALGGDEEKIAKHQAKNGKVAKWDPSDSQDDSDVAAQVDSEMQKELADWIDLATFEGWKDSVPAQSCSRSVAGTSAIAPVATAHK